MAVTNDSVFRHSERYSGSHEKEARVLPAVSRGGHRIRVTAFCQSLSRCNVIDGGDGGVTVVLAVARSNHGEFVFTEERDTVGKTVN